MLYRVVPAVNTARTKLRSIGYNGPVVTTDSIKALKDHPQLCDASDFCAMNCHAFFDGNVLAPDSGRFVADRAKEVSDVARKRTIVAESGWPWQGSPNGKAIPGHSQQEEAIRSLKASFSKDLILFGLYNELWKENTGDTHGTEKNWGIRGNAPSH